MSEFLSIPRAHETDRQSDRQGEYTGTDGHGEKRLNFNPQTHTHTKNYAKQKTNARATCSLLAFWLVAEFLQLSVVLMGTRN